MSYLNFKILEYLINCSKNAKIKKLKILIILMILIIINCDNYAAVKIL